MSGYAKTYECVSTPTPWGRLITEPGFTQGGAKTEEQTASRLSGGDRIEGRVLGLLVVKAHVPITFL